MESQCTRGEINLWLEKLARDRFDQHGQDIRAAINRAELYSALQGLAGNKKTYRPKDFIYQWEPKKPQTSQQMKNYAQAIAHAMGGDVIVDGKKVN